jgi:transcriptional regulator with XRE-family HTH domain
MTPATTLRLWRRRMGVTQAEAAVLLGIHVRQIAGMETEERPVSQRALERMAELDKGPPKYVR